MNDFHTSVLLKEVLDSLKVAKAKKYIDATLGGGGHTFEIVENGGIVLGIDADQDAIDYVQAKVKSQNSKVKIAENLKLVQGNFRDIDTIAHLNGFEKVNGILFDLGVSSHQLDTGERGFSFIKEAVLDMRMDPRSGSQAVTAKDLINGLTKNELYELFTKLGEEVFARRISDSIVSARGVKPIETTLELSQIVKKAVGNRFSKIHPATKVFQALRIAVNDELNNLKIAINKATDLLENQGRLVIISFHSLEDRIVKKSFLELEEKGIGKVVTVKPVTPSFKELEENPRSRSAKLRIFEKL